MRRINRPIRQINLASIYVDPFVVTEALTAEIYLEHASRTESHPTNFFGTEATSTPDLQFQPTSFDLKSTEDAQNIFLLNCNDPDNVIVD